MKKRQSLTMLISATALGVFSAASSVHAAPSEVIYSGDADSNEVALTFDDRANGMNVPSILQTLDDFDISATFFIASYGDEDQIPYIQDIVDQGHQVGNHTYNHPHLTDLSDAQIRNQLESNENFIQNAIGESTKPFFRPAYGDYNQRVLDVVGDMGYSQSIMWSIDTLDWTGNSSDEIVQRVMDGIAPGGIVLMHTGSHASGTTEALPEIITNLDNMGYEFVTIEEMVGTGSPGGETGSTTYTVQAGDTLSAIASEYGTTVDAIASANNISDANFIVTGQTLTIPGTGGDNGSDGGDSTPDEPEQPSTTTYTVEAGDTLWAIASEYNTSVHAIVAENNISNPDFISVGQTLTLPGSDNGSGGDSSPDGSNGSDGSDSTTYTVESGDTLWAIANDYNTSVSALASENNISNPDFISVGQVITIP